MSDNMTLLALSNLTGVANSSNYSNMMFDHCIDRAVV